MPTQTYEFDYSALPAKTRAQLKESINVPGSLVDLHVQPAFKFYAARVAGCLFAGLLLWAALSANFGDPIKDQGWHSSGAGIALFLALTLWCWHVVWREITATHAFGFRPGRYLFANMILDARTQRLRVVDLMGERDPILAAQAFDKATARILAPHLATQREAFRRAFDARNGTDALFLDPMLHVRKVQWVVPGAGARSRMQTLWHQPIARAIAITIVLAPITWFLRNSFSDRAMEQEARRLHTEAAWKGYIDNGSLHVDAMKAELPQVAFDDAYAKASVAAMRGFMQRYQDEALRAKGEERIHELYEKAMDRFRKQASQTDPRIVQTIENLLKVLEVRKDPVVNVRFERPNSQRLARLDDSLKSAESRIGRAIIPAASHFSANTALVREQRVLKELQDAFGTIFPSDVMALVATNTENPKRPQLLIAYDIEQSGAIFNEQEGKRSFVGLVARFQGELTAPGSDVPWRFDMDVEPPDHFSVSYQSKEGAPDEGRVYAVMAERAFDKLSSKIRGSFFRPDSVAFLQRTAAQH